MRHIILLDPIEKLNLSKDTTLYFASSLLNKGQDVVFIFKPDFYINSLETIFRGFIPSFKNEDIALDEINLKLQKNDLIHMRLEPPFDINYLRTLWMLDFLQIEGVKIINDPKGIMNYQEKIFPMMERDSIPSAVITSFRQLNDFAKRIKSKSFILKPLDLFQGYGVTKISIDQFDEKSFKSLVDDFNGLCIAQPFLEEVIEGEIRSIYFSGVEIGSIIKVPKKGNILANIAQGATFEKIELNKNVKDKCNQMATFLNEKGVPWVAFDVLAGKISEANTTCPGLLVEVSKAHNENLSHKIIELIN